MHTASSFIFILAWRSEVSYSFRGAISTSFCCCREETAKSWVPWLRVRKGRKVWLELSAERRTEECRRLYVETEFCWRERSSEWGWRAVETESTLWCAPWAVKGREETFPDAESRAQTRVGRPLHACKRGVGVSDEKLCLNCSLPLEKEVSLQSGKSLFEADSWQEAVEKRMNDTRRPWVRKENYLRKERISQIFWLQGMNKSVNRHQPVQFTAPSERRLVLKSRDTNMSSVYF